jgi:hypothetical protein
LATTFTSATDTERRSAVTIEVVLGSTPFFGIPSVVEESLIFNRGTFRDVSTVLDMKKQGVQVNDRNVRTFGEKQDRER